MTENNTYWNGKGKHNEMLTLEVAPHIPHVGECKTPALEKLRKAQNAYYDLLNNGRASGFKAVFGVSGRRYEDLYCNEEFSHPDMVKVESKLDQLILAAHTEIYG